MKPITPNHAVFFDVDDTLYDHLQPFRAALVETLSTGPDFPYEPAYHRMRYYSDFLSAEAGGTPTHGQELESMRTKRFVRSLGEFGLTLTTEQAATVQTAYLNRQFDIQPFPGAMELIGELQARGIVVGVITNGPPEHQWRKIRALGVDKLIPAELVFISGAVGLTKPDVRLFELIAGKLDKSPEQCCYIGDSWRNDVVGAAGAGWQVIWFNHRGVQPESEPQPLHTPAASYDELARLLIVESL
ncbi:MAG: HAD family hydrolase [Paenibacillus sp.]|jgi:putative hydrolase of the HAD superfamily|uniref:HAD family hydrolase n=1 Tax=Paenibacillus sp. TaxID=58172 RepID=UPI00290C601C|nr:HAD family hydrolase [Paenibacillus sp.]MDU4697834.1 HAD family hydrolase [Paenibacillus sp.]